MTSEGGNYSVRTSLENGTPLSWKGVYRAIRPNRSIEYTWGDNDVKHSTVTLEFIPLEETKTLLRIRQSNFRSVKTMLEHKELWLELLTHLEEYVDHIMNLTGPNSSYDAGDSYY